MDKFLGQLQCAPGTVAFDLVYQYALNHLPPIKKHLPTGQEVEAPAIVKARGAALCFGAILRYTQGKRGQCFANREKLAAAACMSKRSVYTYVLLLEDLGLVIDRHKGQHIHLKGSTEKDPKWMSHTIEITPAGWALLSPDLSASIEPDLSASIAQDLSASIEPDLSASIADKEEEEEEDINTKNIKQDLSAFVIFEAEYGPAQNGTLARIRQLYADPTVPNDWLNEAIFATVAMQADKPLAYLNKVIRDYQANGGPPAPAQREATPAEPTPTQSKADSAGEALSQAELIKLVRERWEDLPGTGVESKKTAQKEKTIETAVKAAWKDHTLDRWIAGGDCWDVVIDRIAGQIVVNPAKAYRGY